MHFAYLNRDRSLPLHRTHEMVSEDPRESQPSLEQLQPPPAALIGTSFPSKNEMETALNCFAATQGYAIVVSRSKKMRWGLQQVYYKCDRSGVYKNSHNLSDGERK